MSRSPETNGFMVNEEYTIKEATAVKLIYEIEKWVNMCCKIIVTFSFR